MNKVFLINIVENNIRSDHVLVYYIGYVYEILFDNINGMTLNISIASSKLKEDKYILLEVGESNIDFEESFRLAVDIFKNNHIYSFLFNNCQDFCSKLIFKLSGMKLYSITIAIKMSFREYISKIKLHSANSTDFFILLTDKDRDVIKRVTDNEGSRINTFIKLRYICN